MLSDWMLFYLCAGLGCNSSVLHALLVSSIHLSEDINSDFEHAAEKGRKQLCQLLIDNGANGYHWALFFAALGGHKELCLFFIDKGANVDRALAGAILRRSFNRYAASDGHKELVEFFQNKINHQNSD